jgi:hypothetical protein
MAAILVHGSATASRFENQLHMRCAEGFNHRINLLGIIRHLFTVHHPLPIHNQ